MALTFPKLNPIVFKEDNILYTEKHNTPFVQKWDKGDYIVFQAHYGGSIERGDVKASMVNEQLQEVIQFDSTIIEINGWYQVIFRGSCNLEDGIYRVKLYSNSGKFEFYSNCMQVGSFPESLLLTYTCKSNKFDCVFRDSEYAYFFVLRVDGGVKSGDISYNADDVFYSSQDRIVYLLDSIPYVVKKYTFGDSYGVPTWLADRINRALSCDNILINGIKVVKNDGAKLETITTDAYPYVGLNIELLKQEVDYSEGLYYDESEMMQSGITVEMVDGTPSYSISAPQTGRIHIETFENTFN